MDDFSVLGNSFENCLENPRSVLVRCEETNLVLNWEKCHLEHLQWAQQIAIFSYSVESSKKLGLQSARYPARHFAFSPSPSTNVASVFSLSRSEHLQNP